MSFYIFDNLCEKGKKYPEFQLVPAWCEASRVGAQDGNADKCPLCGKPISGLKWLPPKKLKLTNTMFPDRLYWILPEDLVVSEKFRRAYMESGLSGIDYFEELEVVEVCNNYEKLPLPGYFSAHIPYSTLIRLDTKGTLTYGRPGDQCDLCNPMGLNRSDGYYIEKLCLDTSSWDGTSIVNVYSVGVVMSQEFFDFVSENHFTNFPFKPVESRPI